MVARAHRLPRPRPGTLDRAGVSALAGFSVSERLRLSNRGPLLTVRRSSDNAVRNINSIAQTGRLNVEQLKAFCIGGAGGFVVQLWDATGNGKHLTQTTPSNQPRIVNAGALETAGTGKPAMVFDGSNDSLARADAMGLTGSPAVTVAWAARSTGDGSDISWALGGTVANSWFGHFPPEPADSPSGSVVGQGGTAYRAFTGFPASGIGAYAIATRAAGATASAFALEANGNALAQQSVGAGGGTATAMVNTTTRLGCNPSGAGNFCPQSLSCWIVFGSVVSGANLTALRSGLARQIG